MQISRCRGEVGGRINSKHNLEKLSNFKNFLDQYFQSCLSTEMVEFEGRGITDSSKDWL